MLKLKKLYDDHKEKIQFFTAGAAATGLVTVYLLRRQFNGTRLVWYSIDEDLSRLNVREQNGQEGYYSIEN